MKYFFSISILCLTLLSCDEKTKDESAKILEEDSIFLNEDHYRAIIFEINRNTEIKISAELKSGPSVELLLMDNNNYNKWETEVTNGQFSNVQISYFPESSISPLASTYETQWMPISKGIYALVIENTDFGNTAPPINLVDDSALIEYKILLD